MMPSGTRLTEQDMNCILDMNSQGDSQGRPRFTFREIAIAVGISERCVALTVRRYAALARRREKRAERFRELIDRTQG